MLLEHAITTELSNLDQLGKNANLFPINEIGVAQGCCLSPFLGNVLLHDFDIEMNKDNVACLRYVDDFIILAKSKDDGHKAYNKALKILQGHGLEAYGLDDRSKTECGATSKKFRFLGCEIAPGLIAPSRESRARMVKTVTDLFNNSIADMRKNPANLAINRTTLVDTLYHVNNIIKGWGNQYSFCTDRQAIEHIDPIIDGLIKSYIGRYDNIKKRIGIEREKTVRRLLGVHLLSDSIQH